MVHFTEFVRFLRTFHISEVEIVSAGIQGVADYPQRR